MKSTNYYNTFIEVAEDCPISIGEVPPSKGGNKTVASLQFELISQNPYQYTSDDVLFSVFASRQDLAESEMEAERQQFFSKGQACFRSSPLTKRYGWGVHSNKEGRIALYGCDTAEYQKLIEDGNLKKVKAMRSKKV